MFLDANALFAAALSPEGVAPMHFAFSVTGACELVTSAVAVADVARNLRLEAPEVVNRWERSSATVRIVAEADPRLVERLAVRLPAKDRPILAAALGCRATVLVTGDRRHFGPLFGRAFGGTVVLSPRKAVALLVEAGRPQGLHFTQPIAYPNRHPSSHPPRTDSAATQLRASWPTPGSGLCSDMPWQAAGRVRG